MIRLRGRPSLKAVFAAFVPGFKSGSEYSLHSHSPITDPALQGTPDFPSVESLRDSPPGPALTEGRLRGLRSGLQIRERILASLAFAHHRPCFAGHAGFEPTTHGFGIRCSTVGASALLKSLKMTGLFVLRGRVCSDVLLVRLRSPSLVRPQFQSF